MNTISKQQVLDQLASLDLSKYPHEEIHKLIQKLGKYGLIVNTFYPGQVLIRARVNYNSEVFCKPQDLSYKPSEYNNTYQRASTPSSTMFYGALLPPIKVEGELDNSRIIGFCEVSKLLRDKSISDGEQTITFGKWVVTEEIHVASIVHQSAFFGGNSYLKQMAEDYNKFIRSYPQEMIEDSLLISEFFANQFSKKETPNDYDYILSAIYAERIIKGAPSLAGILYPSVRADGKGFNVALSPHYADKCLKLVAVAECTIYKKGNLIIGDNDKQAALKPNETEFKLEPITDPKVHLGREAVYKLLNGETAFL